MINSDEKLKKWAFLGYLNKIKSFLVRKIWDYKIEIDRLKSELFHAKKIIERFPEKKQLYKSVIKMDTNYFKQEKKTPGSLYKIRDVLLEKSKLNHSKDPESRRKNEDRLFQYYNKDFLEKEIDHLNNAIVEEFEITEDAKIKRVDLSYQIEVLEKKLNDLTHNAKIIKNFIDKEMKKIKDERNQNLISLFDKIRKEHD